MGAGSSASQQLGVGGQSKVDWIATMPCFRGMDDEQLGLVSKSVNWL